jgi:hypothetical protein
VRCTSVVILAILLPTLRRDAAFIHAFALGDWGRMSPFFTTQTLSLLIKLPTMKHLLYLLLPLLPALAPAQNKPPFEYSELPDDPYHHIPRAGRATSAPYRLEGSGFTIRQVNVDDAGQNILGDAANEPSLVIDPTNPKRMAIGWRQFGHHFQQLPASRPGL